MIVETLTSGMQVIAIEAPVASLPAVNLTVGAGQHSVPQNQQQIPHLLEHLAMRGPDGSPVEFSTWLESCGVIFNAHVHRLWTMFEGRMPAASVRTFLSALSQLAFGPVTWNETHVGVERDIIRAELLGHARDLLRRTPLEARTTAFPNSHYGVGLLESSSALDTISLKDILNFRTRHMMPANSSLIVSGPRAEELFEIACETFDNLPVGERTALPMYGEMAKGLHRELETNAAGHILSVALPAPPYASPDREVMATAYGLLLFGMGSRVYREAVLERGLTYQVNVDIEYSTDQGSIVLFARLSERAGVQSLLEILERHVTEIGGAGFSDQELRRAAERYVTRLHLVEEDPEAALRRHAQSLLLTRRPFVLREVVERIRQLGRDELSSTWRRYMDWPNANITVVTGKEANHVATGDRG